MCGIFGALGLSLPDEQFNQLFNSIRHRGPDGQGQLRAGSLQLAMNRLRLRGASVNLPLVRHGNIAAFNGQVYGTYSTDGAYSQLPDDINHEFDSLVSNDCNIDGMYAYAIASEDGLRLRLATDFHFIKPLFIRKCGQGFAFSSEFSTLLTLSTKNLICPAALCELFAYGWYLSGSTYIRDIDALCYEDLSVYGRSCTSHAKRLYDIEERLDVDFDLYRLRKSVHESVARCVGGSGPFGLAISGGLDSTIIAWELNALDVRDLITISVRSPQTDDFLPSLDQLHLPPGGAWETWRHRVVEFTDDEDFLSTFETSALAFGQPTTMSSLPLYWKLAEAASNEGVRVLLTGEGVDEYFCGYNSYNKLRELPSILDFYCQRERTSFLEKLFSPAELHTAQTHFADRYSSIDDLRVPERDLRLKRLLLRTDVCLMSKSIEGRTPFLHNSIPEMAMSRPWQEHASAGGKRLLRLAYSGMLGVLAKAPKTRFKADDRLLQRLLASKVLQHRIRKYASLYFPEKGVGQSIEELLNADNFDADICCLLLSLTFLIENGSIQC